ncbi:hypothetical protein [Oricola sp.]|uniref:hypothetical protein n=1 Tax=Oricola sp. TaxID=1979950 RepID=UPI003BAC5CD5
MDEVTDLPRRISAASGTFLSLAPVIHALLAALAGTAVITVLSGNESLNYEYIYSGVFDLISLFTGFLGTFYVFVVTKGNRFLQAIQRTPTFAAMVHLLKFTIVWSVGMIVCSYVLVILNPKDLEFLSVEQAFVFFWVFNVTLIVYNFTRCVRQFGIATDITKGERDV